MLIGERIILTLWVGALWSIGYIVAPLLFASLDRALAGDIAGELFRVVSYLGLVCGSLLLLLSWMRKAQYYRARLLILPVMLLLISLNQFAVSPTMQSLKQTGLIEGSQAASQFGMWHGVSASIYLIVSLLGLALVVMDARTAQQQSR